MGFARVCFLLCITRVLVCWYAWGCLRSFLPLSFHLSKFARLCYFSNYSSLFSLSFSHLLLTDRSLFPGTFLQFLIILYLVSLPELYSFASHSNTFSNPMHPVVQSVVERIPPNICPIFLYPLCFAMFVFCCTLFLHLQIISLLSHGLRGVSGLLVSVCRYWISRPRGLRKDGVLQS
ncbi:hypothetical protein BU24DRAFT_102123 [Aaosphaeria arxii CBS 175.79]|uniref:Uncharacterized protein n=1 Tax=Aaosphaeria arxii CBS 175.79 TaxID=1450172 RepID=A0A6A5XZQ4_9PLEO|nr:uncharacterized protein BU24DRAFT_102123 [Aaosphaeria arxii CBS 175.79]KAF2018682.1 hypothetical protein BU24DRAFT_102123 [Aaosphaeria arxii CBS 175.79]